MPSRRTNKSSRSRRQPVRRPVRPVVPAEGFSVEENAAEVTAAVPPRTSTVRPSNSNRPSTRTRSRAPAQIVIANYDFLRRDLRLLGVLAPGLVVVMIVLSFVVH